MELNVILHRKKGVCLNLYSTGSASTLYDDDLGASFTRDEFNGRTL